MRRAKRICVAAIALCVGACTVGPDYAPPKPTLPAQFTTVSSARTQPEVDLSQWWQALKDPELDALIARAIAANPDVDIALARLQEERTREAVIAGEQLPLVEANGSIAKGTGSNSTRGRVSGPLNAATDATNLREITQVVGFDAGWELDLFGQLRREAEAARANTQAAFHARNAVLIAVVADVARTYFNLRGSQLRLGVMRKDIDVARQGLDFVRTRFKLGITNELDVALAARELGTLSAQLAPLQADIATEENGLAVLLGTFPDNIRAELERPGALPQLPAQVQTGLPLALLKRRPDIQEAERKIAVANATIGVATAALFPEIALSGAAGVQGQGLGRSPATNTFIWSVGPSAYWPILDFGTLDAQIENATFQRQEQLVNYRKTVQEAVREVDDSISNYASQQDRLTRLNEAVNASERAVALAAERYDRGLTDYLNVLDAERENFSLKDQFIAARTQAGVQLIGLYKALGGGWEHFQNIPPIRQPQPAILALFERG